MAELFDTDIVLMSEIISEKVSLQLLVAYYQANRLFEDLGITKKSHFYELRFDGFRLEYCERNKIPSYGMIEWCESTLEQVIRPIIVNDGILGASSSSLDRFSNLMAVKHGVFEGERIAVRTDENIIEAIDYNCWDDERC